MYAGSRVKRDLNPRDKTGIFRLLTFLYTVDIFKKSNRSNLKEDDIYEVLNNCRSSSLGDLLESAWKQEKLKPHPSLSKAIWRVFGKEYMFYGIMNCIIRVATTMIRPRATGKLVEYFSPESKLTQFDAYYYGIQIISCAFAMTIFRQYYLMSMFQIGLRVRISLCSLMYRKALKLTSSSLMEVTNGRILTMMSRDVQIFDNALLYTHDIWVGLIQIVIMTFIMYNEVQSAAFVGLAFLIVLIPLQFYIGVITKNLRLKASSATDDRLRRIQEILTSIKLIKLYTWQKYYTELTNKLRIKELYRLKKIFYLKAVVLSLSSLSHRISYLICILVYSYLGSNLTAGKAFIILTCYNSLHIVLAISIPMGISLLAESKSCIKRVKSYLLIDDVENIKDEAHIIKGVKVFINNAKVDFFNTNILENVNLEATPSLIGITGAVGTGKSTFLKIILKDIHLSEGQVHTMGVISYASQEPWLFPGTVRQNILFGLPYDKKRYQDVIRVCALVKDFQSFSQRDNTIVNDKGLNLSKGQQARINLARAVYKKADIYLLDDVMSSLDASSSKYVFQECIKEYLKGKLVILVCHNERLLRDMDKILVFNNRTIQMEGNYQDLKNKDIDFGFYATVDSYAPTDVQAKVTNIDTNSDENSKLLVSQEDLCENDIYNEFNEEGKVNFSAYRTYFYQAGGWLLIPMMFLVCLVAQGFMSYFDVYVKTWVNIEANLTATAPTILENNTFVPNKKYEELLEDKQRATIIYLAIILISSALAFSRLIYFFELAILASKRIHRNVFGQITGACMSFFDKHLSGNILNRFSKDLGIIDEQLAICYLECIRISFILIFVFIVIASINIYIASPGLLMLVIMMSARSFYLKTSRNLKRLDASTRAPMVGYLNSSLEGLTTIRASGNQDILTAQFDNHQDLNSSTSYMFTTTSRAFGYWLDMICNMYIAAVIFYFIYFKGIEKSASDVGIVITQSFALAGVMQWGVRQWAELESLMTSVERVSEYSHAEQEITTGSSPDNWPANGRIQYKNVSLKYSKSDTYVLKNVNFTIEPKQKVGIIGRTGAGKSSIISALFRLYDIEGSVLIDGIDITDMELELVRSQIAIIPQDPVLFEGTIRTNLDPKGLYTDLQLWSALGEVELKSEVETLEMGLESDVKDGGANFSIGQRQLICLARAILRNNKILVLDEATANIDPLTDLLIQKTVKRLFIDCTVLTIAHRLNTIINSDQIIVVDGGSVVEVDDPEALLARQTGIFYSMAKQAGMVN